MERTQVETCSRVPGTPMHKRKQRFETFYKRSFVVERLSQPHNCRGWKVRESGSDHRSGSSRPSQQFVPASERYAASAQKTRQERRLRRQAELLALQGRSRLSRTSCTPLQEPQLCSTITQGRSGSTRKVGARCPDESVVPDLSKSPWQFVVNSY